MKDKLVALMILDGYGFNPKTEGNAVITSYSIHYTKLYDISPR